MNRRGHLTAARELRPLEFARGPRVAWFNGLTPSESPGLGPK